MWIVELETPEGWVEIMRYEKEENAKNVLNLLLSRGFRARVRKVV